MQSFHPESPSSSNCSESKGELLRQFHLNVPFNVCHLD